MCDRGSFGSLRGTKDRGILSNISSLYYSSVLNTYYIVLILLSNFNYKPLDFLEEIKSLLSHYKCYCQLSWTLQSLQQLIILHHNYVQSIMAQ